MLTAIFIWDAVVDILNFIKQKHLRKQVLF